MADVSGTDEGVAVADPDGVRVRVRFWVDGRTQALATQRMRSADAAAAARPTGARVRRRSSGFGCPLV